MGEFLGAFGVEIGDDAEPDYFTFYGEQFTVGAKVSALPVLAFAAETQISQGRERRARRQLSQALTEHGKKAAQTELTEAEIQMLAAMHAFLKDTIGRDQWDRFYPVALEHGCDVDELLAVCQTIYAALTGRPTKRPSDSSDGPSVTGSGSTGDSASPVPTVGPISPAVAARADIQRALTPVSDAIRSSA